MRPSATHKPFNEHRATLEGLAHNILSNLPTDTQHLGRLGGIRQALRLHDQKLADARTTKAALLKELPALVDTFVIPQLLQQSMPSELNQAVADFRATQSAENATRVIEGAAIGQAQHGLQDMGQTFTALLQMLHFCEVAGYNPERSVAEG
jgi:hypothetical protein